MQTTNDTNGDMKKPSLYKKDKWKQKAENMTKEEWEEDSRNKYLTTWTSPDGNTSRQIEYIMINAKQRNIVRKAQNNIYWHGNMNQNQQHRVQTTQLYYSAAKIQETHTYRNRYASKI